MPLSELLKLYDIEQSEIGVAEEGREDELDQDELDEDDSSNGGYHCLILPRV